MKPKLIIDDAIPFLEGRLDHAFDCTYMPGELITRSDLKDADGLLVRTRTRCDAALLEGTPVTFVATGTIGLDHIDTAWCDANSIHWQNAPGCNAPAVAQYVFRALLHLGLPLHLSAGTPQSGRPVLGVVGKGNVGSIVVEWGRRFGLNVIVSDPPRAAAGHTDEEYLPIDELFERSDAVTFHTPLIRRATPIFAPTWHMATSPLLARLRPGALLVNASRGGVIDETDLLEAKLRQNLRIAIDTWEGEPSVSTRTLTECADIATFHIAGYSRQGKERATWAILSGLEKHFGVTLPLDGLATPYTPPAELTEERLRASYDIMADDCLMRRDYRDFERLRNTYPLREEIL